VPRAPFDCPETVLSRLTVSILYLDRAVTMGLLLPLALAMLGQTDLNPRVDYDKFEDEPVISLDLGKIAACDAAESQVQLIASHEGKSPKRFTAAGPLLVFSRTDKSFEWKDDDFHDVKILCGDVRVPMLLKPNYWSKAFPAINKCSEKFIVSPNLQKTKQLLETCKDWEVK
jgi:hypothetical protein